MMFFHEYKINWWNDDKEAPDTAVGLVVGATLQDAVDRICSWYGEKNINSLSISYIDNTDGGLLEFAEGGTIYGSGFNSL